MSQVLLIPGLGRLNLQRLLFGAGEVGGIYDWSDRSTMFQDVAGTQPITASGQTRALHLDKSKGLVPGPELVTNGDGSSTTGWSTFGTVTSFASIAGAFQIETPNSRGDEGVRQVLTGLVAGRFYRVSVSLRIANAPAAGQTASLRWANGNVTFGFTTLLPTSSTSTVSLSGVFSPSGTSATIALVNGGLGSSGGGPFTTEFDNISVRELPGNHRYQASASSRPQYIEDETGHYGLYDGIDDFDETNAVDFTGTDKVTVWWGGRKLSDAATSMAIEASVAAETNDGAFNFITRNLSGDYRYQALSRGTIARFAATTDVAFTAPHSAVATSVMSITPASVALRINGVQVAVNTFGQGTGNYGNHKLYFGRRAGTSLAANIREYMTIIRGAQTATPLIERVEREVRRHIKGLTW